jgi:hypothetical protein
MGRKRTRPLQGEGTQEPAKYSFLVPVEIDRKVLEVCRLRGNMSQSDLLRLVLEENLDRYLSAARGAPPGAALSGDGAGMSRLRIGLSEPVQRALDLAARDLNLDLTAIVQMIIAEQLPAIMARAREQRKKLEAALGEDGRESG